MNPEAMLTYQGVTDILAEHSSKEWYWIIALRD